MDEWGGITAGFDATVYQNFISENTADFGGGVYCSEFTSFISQNIVTDNAATMSGGGIYYRNSSGGTISNNIIARNTATDNGGGIYCLFWSDPSIENNTLTNNSAGGYGGGLVCMWTSSTTIVFEIPGAEGERHRVALTIYDVRGQRVRTLIDSDLPPGIHKVTWDGRDDRGGHVSSGIFIYRLTTSGGTDTRKMILIK